VSLSYRYSFLQWGSPHALSNQAQYISAERSEVWVNIGYRLNVFGFLASDEPKIAGNFGFKDQWLAILWVKDNIACFGGEYSCKKVNDML
jgi:carboxylesterase type B